MKEATPNPLISLSDRQARKQIGQRARLLRGSDITRQQVGLALGIKAQQVGRIERGEVVVDVLYIVRLAAFYGVQPSALIDNLDGKRDADQLPVLINLLLDSIPGPSNRYFADLLTIMQDISSETR